MKVLKRIWNFDEIDMNHMKWLIKGLITSFVKLDYEDFQLCCYLIKLHCIYDCEKIIQKENTNG